MKTRRKVLLWVVALVAFAAVFWAVARFSEPRYQGKRLSDWLTDLAHTPPEDLEARNAATKAIRQMGPSAVPFLLHLFAERDTRTKALAQYCMQEWFGLDLKTRSARESENMARLSFLVLGRDGEAAIPVLAAAFAKHTDKLPAARELLESIGSSNCVPVFLRGLTNSDQEVRRSAAVGLALMRGNARSAAPFVLPMLNDPDPERRQLATFVIGNIGLEPQVAVPSLVKQLTDPDASVRYGAAHLVGEFGQEAGSAMAALNKLTQDTDTNVCASARRSVLRIQCQMRDGGIIRGPTNERKVALTFTGHEFAEGGGIILDELARHKARGSFFLTGHFLTESRHTNLIERIIRERHYLGPHSYNHLLYCDWEDPQKTLVTQAEFERDLESNKRAIALTASRLGASGRHLDMSYLSYTSPSLFLPPFEHYNRDIVGWCKNRNTILINYTPGTRSNADYTGEADKNFVSSQTIFDSILKIEREDPNGLNGFILLLHIGAGPGRADRFHTRFGELLDVLAAKGYQFVRVDELLEPK